MILVVGATGDVGGQVARRLLDQGRPVRVLVREGSAYQPLVAAGAEAFIGDLKDPGSVTAACQGAEVVVTTATAAARGGADTPEAVDRQGNRNLIDATKEAGVRRFVLTSVLVDGAMRSHPFMQAKLDADSYLRSSGLEHTIVRPTLFMDTWIGLTVLMPLQIGGPVIVPGSSVRKHSFVAGRDVAAILVSALDHPAAKDAVIEVGGPEALSWSDVVERCESILGRPVGVHRLSDDNGVPGLPPEVAALLAATDTYDSVVEMRQTASTFGVELTTVDDFLRAALAPGS